MRVQTTMRIGLIYANRQLDAPKMSRGTTHIAPHHLATGNHVSTQLVPSRKALAV